MNPLETAARIAASASEAPELNALHPSESPAYYFGVAECAAWIEAQIRMVPVKKQRCDGCQYWSTDKQEARRADGTEVRRCKKALQWWDASKWTDKPDPTNEWENLRVLTDEAKGNKMFVQDGSDYHADLLTAADFWCAHFTTISPAAVIDGGGDGR